MFYIKEMKNYKLNYNIKMYQNILIFKIHNINYLNFFNDYSSIIDLFQTFKFCIKLTFIFILNFPQIISCTIKNTRNQQLRVFYYLGLINK